MSAYLLKFIPLFFAINLLLIAAHLIGGERAFFNLEQENNLPTTFAALQVLLVALVMLEIFRRERIQLKAIVPGRWIWFLLGMAFIYLAVDDMARIHERFLRHDLRDLLPPESVWISLMPWQIIFGPFLAIVAATLIVTFLTRLSKRRTLWVPAVIALGCWVTAVLLEGLAKPLFMVQGWYNLGVVLEEGLELFGGTFFLLAFTRYAQAIRADFRPESFAGRTGYTFLKASGVLVLIIGAGATFVALLTVQNSAWLHRHNAGVLAKRGKYDKAIVAFNQAIAKNPQDIHARLGLGEVYIQQRDFLSALNTYDAAIVIDGTVGHSWQRRGLALEHLARDVEAEHSYRRALKLTPNNAALWKQLGGLLQRHQKLNGAITSYQASLKLQPIQPQLRQFVTQLQDEFARGMDLGVESSTAATTGANSLDAIDDPLKDGWETEDFTNRAYKQLKVLESQFKQPGSITAEEFAALVTADFACGKLLPENLSTVMRDETVWVQRGQGDPARRPYAGAKGLVTAIKQMLGPLRTAKDVHSKIKTFRIHPEPDVVTTKHYVACSGRVADEMVEQNATWVVEWAPAGGNELPRMRSIHVESFEQVQTASGTGPMFADCTEAVLAQNACYEPQLLRGFNHWLQTSQRRRHLFRLGTPGIAVADVNGDGYEDLYLCQEVGLPNRLFLHQADDTVKDVSAEWEVDWIQDSRSALFFDWDNDGDQDLAVSVLGGVILARNEGNKRFQLHKVLSTSDDTMSLSTADYDLDGDLDLYVCVYRRDELTAGEATSMLPGAVGNFVYHDANSGGPCSLFQNDGNGGFTNVTEQVGLDSNNHRFSYAASWEDYDNDGDADLYVANDFGRDNLYRNDGGHFVDIGAEANVEDSASGMALTWSDYNHDGWMDVFVSNMWSSAGNRIAFQPKFKANAPPEVKQRIQRLARGNTLLKNRGDGTFEHVSSQAAVEVGRWAWGSKFVDLNNDSWDDLVVANGFITTDDSGDL